MTAIAVAGMVEGENEILPAVEQALRDGFGVKVRRRAPLGEPAFAWDAQRRQYSAPLILKRLLGEHAPAQEDKLLAVTGHDLFIPMLSFVFGQAQLDGQVALVSTARLRTGFYGLPPDPELLEVRVRKEALHEVGHLFGLLHCPDPACAMALSTGIRQLDLKQPGFCAGCAWLARERRAGWEARKRV